MKLFDLSVPFSGEIPFYPGDPTLSRTEHSEIAKGAVCNISVITFGTHTSTHLDSPKHFIDDGKAMEDEDLSRFIGMATVVDARGRSAVDASVLRDIPLREGMNLLFRTDNGDALLHPPFRKDFVAIAPDAAAMLSEARVNLVGIDYLSVEAFGSRDFPTHRTLLGADILLLEGLLLTHVEPGTYHFSALPLRIPNANGSPCRAILWQP